MGRGRYIVRRLALMIPTLIGLSILTFIISHVVPADPAKLAAGPRATPDMIEAIHKKFGLDQPIYVQYYRFLKQLVHGDFGVSITTQHSVNKDLHTFFPATLELVLASMIIAIAIGVPLGIIAATHQNKWPDQVSRIFAISSVSLPQFWLGVILQLLLAMSWHLLPSSGRLPTLDRPPHRVTGMYSIDTLLAGEWPQFWSSLSHLVMPASVLAIGSLAIITRTLRGDLLEAMNMDFVRTARAKGLSSRTVLFRHVLRNAFIPSLTMIGLSLGWTLGGTVLVETIFDWPGIGLYAVNAATQLDFEPIMGVTMLVGVIFIAINLCVDLLYSALDPRIKYA
jgi:peptide/nickel transport system permease protein